MELLLLTVALLSFIITALFTPLLINILEKRKIVGKDMHKPGTPEVPDTGGLAIAVGVILAIFITIIYSLYISQNINITLLGAAVLTLIIIEVIGLYDDLFTLRQIIKAVIPMAAAIPLLLIVSAITGMTSIAFPFIGSVDFGLLYVLALIPLGIAVASNLTNMLAGFNGSETGMGIVIFLVMSILFFANGKTEALIISLAMFGALVAFLRFNWYPAKIFPGDATTLLIGGTLAVVVVIGKMEVAGALLVVPYVVDFFIKAANGFPKTFVEYREDDGKLYSPNGKVRGLADLILVKFNGLREDNLSLVLIGIEAVVGLIVLVLYAVIL